MSFFHKSITDAIRVLDEGEAKQEDKAGVLQKIHDILDTHVKAVKKEFAYPDELKEELTEYFRHLEDAIQLCQSKDTRLLDPSNPWWKQLREHLNNAHNLVAKLESTTRRLLGDEHKFLE
jgi:uncharacterized protein YaaN involved in tellurite resistance